MGGAGAEQLAVAGLWRGGGEPRFRRGEALAEDRAALWSRVGGADLRLYLAQRRFGRALDELVRKYRPDQPRVPKGTPDIGGEWTIDPGSARQRRLAAERVRVAQAGGSIDRYSVNLLAEEFKGPPGNQGHSVERHVGKSGEELVALLADTRRVVAQTPTELTYRAKKAWGSFPTISEGNELVSQALLANQTQLTE